MKLKKWNGSSWVQEYPEVDVNSIVATGTPSSTTYLRGDGSWATVTSGTTFTGGTITGNIEISNTLPKITLTDTDHNSDFNIANSNGVFTIGDTTNQLDRFRIYSSGDVEITGSSVDISGVTLFNDNGTLKWDGTIVSLNGHTHTFASLTSKPTTLSGYGITDAYSSSNPSGYQTAAQVASAVSALVDSAPTTLDTLNELAAALGDDPNFATTVSTNIGTKVSKSGDTMTGNLTATGFIVGDSKFNQQSGYAQIVTGGNELVFDSGASDLYFNYRLGTSGVAINSFLWKGGSSSTWASHQMGSLYVNGNISVTGTVDGVDIAAFKSSYDSHNHDSSYLGISAKAADSNLLDGIDSSAFLRSNATDTATGALTLSNTSNHYSGHHYFDAYDANGNHYPHYLNGANNNGAQVNMRVYDSNGNYQVFYINGNSNNMTWRGHTIWNSGNDGSGSGLSADNVDGYHIVVGSTGSDANTLYFTT